MLTCDAISRRRPIALAQCPRPPFLVQHGRKKPAPGEVPTEEERAALAKKVAKYKAMYGATLAQVSVPASGPGAGTKHPGAG